MKDGSGNVVPNVTVTFTAPSSGASGTFAGGSVTTTATANSTGVATASVFTANGTAGSYSVTASVSGVSSNATFSLTNTVIVGLNISPTPATVKAGGMIPFRASVTGTDNTAVT